MGRLIEFQERDIDESLVVFDDVDALLLAEELERGADIRLGEELRRHLAIDIEEIGGVGAGDVGKVDLAVVVEIGQIEADGRKDTTADGDIDADPRSRHRQGNLGDLGRHQRHRQRPVELHLIARVVDNIKALENVAGILRLRKGFQPAGVEAKVEFHAGMNMPGDLHEDERNRGGDRRGGIIEIDERQPRHVVVDQFDILAEEQADHALGIGQHGEREPGRLGGRGTGAGACRTPARVDGDRPLLVIGGDLRRIAAAEEFGGGIHE